MNILNRKLGWIVERTDKNRYLRSLNGQWTFNLDDTEVKAYLVTGSTRIAFFDFRDRKTGELKANFHLATNTLYVF